MLLTIMIDSILISLSTSKLFNGCVMLLTNIGGKYLVMDMPNNMEKLFSKYIILRCLVLFSIFFMATRDVKTSVLLSLLFFIVIKFIINEKSSFCLINDKDKIIPKISSEDYTKAKSIIDKYHTENIA